MSKKNKGIYYITKYSNVIQYDSMGYPLRLVTTSNEEQIWVDTTYKEGDVVLQWTSI